MKPQYLLPLLLSCHSTGERLIHLTPEAIYSVDSVKKAAGPSHQNAVAAAYYQLGDSLLGKGFCDTAMKAFRIAEKLDFQPRADLLYKLSASYAGKIRYASTDSTDSADQYMYAAAHYAELAIQMGYSHPENFHTDHHFDTLRNCGFFISSYSDALDGRGKAAHSENALWGTFLSEFPPLPLPLNIDQAWIRTHPPQREVAYVHEAFVPELRTLKFSRGTDHLYYYVGLIKKTDAYAALLYAGKSLELMQDEADTRATFFYLVTYDNCGKIIDKIQVAGQQDFTGPARTFALQPDLRFEIRSFTNVYQHDPEKGGYNNNPVIRQEPAGETAYRITPAGKFEKLQPTLALR